MCGLTGPHRTCSTLTQTESIILDFTSLLALRYIWFSSLLPFCWLIEFLKSEGRIILLSLITLEKIEVFQSPQ